MWPFKRYPKLQQDTEHNTGETHKVKLGLSICRDKYADFMTLNTYRRILFDTYNAMFKLKNHDVINQYSYDSYSPHQMGLISLIAKNMTAQTKNYYDVVRDNGLVFFSPTNEKELDRNTVCLDFTCFYQSTLLKDIFKLDFDNLIGFGVGVYTSRALLVRLADLNQITISEQDKRMQELLAEQVKSLVNAINSGNVGVISNESNVERVATSTSANKEADEFINKKLSSITGYSEMFFDGQQDGGLGQSGVSQNRMNEDARAFYFHSVLGPVYNVVEGEAMRLKPNLDNLQNIKDAITVIETSESLSDVERDLIKSAVGLIDGNG